MLRRSQGHLPGQARPGHSRGATLLNVLLASTLLPMVMVGLFDLHQKSGQLYKRAQNRLDVQQNSRIATETMARELRLAGYDPSNQIPVQAPPTAFQTAAAATVTFLADVDGDQQTDRVTYQLTGTDLTRRVDQWNTATSSWTNGTPSQLATGISGLTLTYLDAAGAPTAVLANIRSVQLALTVTVSGAEPASYRLDLRLRARNL